MKVIRPYGWAFLWGAWLALCIIGCEWLESEENFYSNYSEIQSTGNKGMWIPPFLPPSAVDIREFHYIDNRSVWITFRFKGPSNEWPENAGCRRVDSPPTMPSKMRVRAIWWPDELTAEHHSTDGPQPYEFFECSGDLGGSIAVRALQYDEAFFWR